MLNQSNIYSRLKISLYIPGSIKTLRIYTRDFIYPAYYYKALWHNSSLLKRFNSNNEYALYLTRFTYDIMFGCYKQKQRYVFWYEKWQKKKKKNIFHWGNPGERLSECVEGVEIYKINLKKITYLKSFMQRIIQKRILKHYTSHQLLCSSIWLSWHIKGPYADHISSPKAQPEVVYFLISNESPYFSSCKSKISASNSL